MPALSEHLRDPEGHARMAFHPGCPICHGERLSGTLPMQAVISQRTRAALTAGVVAVATVAPAAALGAEPHITQAGSTTAAGTASGDRALTADFIPGGNAAATGTVVDTGADNNIDDDDTAGDDSAADHGGASDGVTVVVGGGAGTQSGGDQSATAPAQPAPPPELPAVPVAPAPAATSDRAPSPAASSSTDVSAGPSDPPPAPTPDEATTPSADASAAPRAPSTPGGVRAGSRPPATHTPSITHAAKPRLAPASAMGAADATTPTPTPTPAPTPTRTTATPASIDRADPGDRAHTVHTGESLWSIASDHLGAGAAPAQIAREVHRLWQLNADRIGTGDPDLLMVGTRLVLR